MAIMNQVKTVLLLGALTGLLLLIGSFWGKSGLLIALIFSALINLGSYWFSDKIALAIYRAKPISEKEAPKLYKIVKEVCMKADIPVPKIFIIKAPFANAFATGRNPKHASIAVTEGILDLLNENELKGVIAHEISHIKNRDILVASAAATIAGVISYIATMAQWSAIFGGGNDDEGGMSGIGLLAFAIITPLIATIIQLAISRSREYLADASGAKLIGTGNGLADALHKLEESTKNISLRPNAQAQATSHLFITNPFRGKSFFSFFMTHPPAEERIKRLRTMRV